MENEQSYAGFSRRLLAHNIDLLPILILLYACSFVIPKVGFDWLLFLVIYLSYYVGFESSKWRATPGKKWARIHVEIESGKQLLIKSLIRNLSKLLSLALFFGGFVMIIFNVKQKALHDYLAGAVVLFEEH